MKKKKKIKLITDGVGFDTFAVFPSRAPESNDSLCKFCTLTVVGYGYWNSKLIKGSYNNCGEKSAFVPNISKEDAMERMKRYGVESIVFAERTTNVQENIEYSTVKMELIYVDGTIAGTRVASWEPENGWNYNVEASGQEFYAPYFDNGMIHVENTYDEEYEDVYHWFLQRIETQSEYRMRANKLRSTYFPYIIHHQKLLYNEVERYESGYYNVYKNRTG